MRPDPLSMQAAAAPERTAAPVSLWTLALLFLRIGCTGFGGFMAMVAVTQQVLCERRRLLPQADLLDGLALASVLPGPVAVNVAAYAGYRLRGAAGAVIALLCAVLPAFFCMVALGTLYLRYGSSDALRPIFAGIAPAIVAIVLAAGCRLWQGAVHDGRQAALGVGAALVMVWQPGLATTLSVMAVAAAIGYHSYGGRSAPSPALASRAPLAAPQGTRRRWPQRLAMLLVAPLAALALLSASPILLQLLGVFSSMSLLAFGGGYVFIPLLQHTVVEAYHWLTPAEFTDALAITQLSPGPAMISSALIGLKVAGFSGATAASIGMFVPSAMLIVAASGAMQRIRSSTSVQAALSGMRAALSGMVFAAAVTISRSHPLHLATVLVCVAALFALLRLRVDAAVAVLCAALSGWLFF
ncbi:chromate efflux transporter [Duganella sp. CY15W]|uniref:chromate efflux transporter n=1 Tax=Duganella sp. CY15W TaxID=2692172 RepID=UPI001E5A877E|nr:chromate efflux transporter [Duganella sp. CY15W]